MSFTQSSTEQPLPSAYRASIVWRVGRMAPSRRDLAAIKGDRGVCLATLTQATLVAAAIESGAMGPDSAQKTSSAEKTQKSAALAANTALWLILAKVVYFAARLRRAGSQHGALAYLWHGCASGADFG